MLTAVLAWSTVASNLGVAGYVARYLWRTGRRPWSWQQPLRIPKLARHAPILGSGSDYVGGIL